MTTHTFHLDHSAVTPEGWSAWCENPAGNIRSAGAQDGHEIVSIDATSRRRALRILLAAVPAGTVVLDE